MVFGDPAELAAYQQLVAAFEAAHPDIQIELRHVPGQSAYQKQLVTAFSAGAQPDVMLLDMNLPVMDGWTVARTLREDAATAPHIRVITRARLRADRGRRRAAASAHRTTSSASPVSPSFSAT